MRTAAPASPCTPVHYISSATTSTGCMARNSAAETCLATRNEVPARQSRNAAEACYANTTRSRLAAVTATEQLPPRIECAHRSTLYATVRKSGAPDSPARHTRLPGTCAAIRAESSPATARMCFRTPMPQAMVECTAVPLHRPLQGVRTLGRPDRDAVHADLWEPYLEAV